MGKLTFVLIDDEIYATRHLKRLICSASPEYRILSTYTDGAEALRQCPALIPDVAFVDIIMPGMSGLEFAERFHSLCPDTRIIILTAYRDFEFAQKSLTIGVSDYWLKNELRPATVEEKLQQLEKEVVNMQQKRRRQNEEHLMKCLTGECRLREAFPPASGQEVRYFLIVCQHDQIPKAVSALCPCLKSQMSKLQIAMTDFLFTSFYSETNAFSIGRLVSETSVGLSRIWEKCIVALESQSGRFSDGRIIVRGYFSEKEYRNHYLYDTIRIISNLHVDPQKTLTVLDKGVCEYFLHDGELYRYLEETYFSKMQQALAESDQERFTALYDELTQAGYLVAGNQSAIDYTISRISEIFGDTDGSAEFLQKLQKDAKSESIETLLSRMRPFLEEMVRVNGSGESISAKIRPIIRYIHKNYHRDLNVSSLASEFNISGDYLRKLFKAKMGIGLANYITKVRIDAAERLVKTGRYRIYEISERVGYHSASYFSQTYHKYKGYYPTDPKSRETTA